MDKEEPAVIFHDRIASKWDARYSNSGSFFRRAEFFRKRIVPFIGAEGRWLDAGCGTGYFSRLICNSGVHVLGIDPSLSMVEEARRLSSGHSGSLKFEKIRTIESLDYSDSVFDGCICLSVLEYVSSPQRGLDEIIRVVRPGGTIIISVPNSFSPIRVVQGAVSAVSSALKMGTGGYRLLSRFATTPSGLRRILSSRNITSIQLMGFDPIMSPCASTFLPTSLIFAVGIKS